MAHEHLIIHQILEFISYLVGGYIFRRGLRNAPLQATLTLDNKIYLLFGLVCGAFFGSKILATLTYWDALQGQPFTIWFQGKTIVGGLLGGLIGIEISKKSQQITSSTGDLFAIPLIVAIAIGRIGCAQAGVEDYTFGNPTTLPWGMNLGDGIPRHPTAIYEIIFLLVLGIILANSHCKTSGMKFKIFLALYLLFRFLVDFLKPPHGNFAPVANIMPATSYWGLSAIQIACLAGIVYYVIIFYRLFKVKQATAARKTV